MNNRNENVKHKTKHPVLRKEGEQLLKWGGHSVSLDKTKYNAEGNADSLRVATKSCNKQTLKILQHINMNHNRSTALERSVKKLLRGGGLNRFYGYQTSPSASIMAQNIQFFGPREGFLTHQWIITWNK